MTSKRKVESHVTGPVPPALWLNNPSRQRYRLATRLFAHRAVGEVVATRVHFNASREAIWNHIMFYEEVPGRPPFLLRTLLPHAVRTEGDKTRVGATVLCTYHSGSLRKRITSIEPPCFLEFEVIEQILGIEHSILTRGGSYQLYPSGGGTDVILITNYLAYLHPRFLWRPLETLLVNQLHRHILRGVGAAVLPNNTSVRTPIPESLTR